MFEMAACQCVFHSAPQAKGSIIKKLTKLIPCDNEVRQRLRCVDVWMLKQSLILIDPCQCDSPSPPQSVL